MSTRIGIIAEGLIDYALLPALIERVARERAGFDWPTLSDDLADVIPIRRRGHGGVLTSVTRLVQVLDSSPTEHAFFVILLDRRTREVQTRIRRLIRGKEKFLLAIAIEEIEAWWLADRRNCLAWLGLDDTSGGMAAYFAAGYSPESDRRPKATLDELTRLSTVCDSCYGVGNTALAREFATNLWTDHADVDAIERACPRGFRPFCRDATNVLVREKQRQGRLR